MGGPIMTFVLWISIAALVCGCIIQSVRVILREKKRERAHEVLLNRVMRLRFHKMLKFLGVDQSEYLKVVPSADINQQIHRCSHCNALDICDSCLRDGKWIANLSFCPNHKSILKHSDTIHRHRLT